MYSCNENWFQGTVLGQSRHTVKVKFICRIPGVESLLFGVCNGMHIELRRVKQLKGVLHLLPQKAPKLACFTLYLKIIGIFLKNNICTL